ncbi:MAG: hypothetical protein HYV40_03445, partial [Candidatus Levybacteria bacterium]|nr:hypothetical protein [Candidatus Levybacteria bacterium]
MFIVLLIIFLLLPLSPQVHAAESENSQVIQCQRSDFAREQINEDTQMRCNVSLQDASGNTLSGVSTHVLVDGVGHATDDIQTSAGPIGVSFDTTSNPFQVCGYLKSAGEYPSINKVTVSVPGYTTKTVDVGREDCGDLDQPIKLDPLPAGSKLYTCDLQNTSTTGVVSCTETDAATCTDPELCFSDSACSNKCGLFFQAKTLEGKIECVNLANATRSPDVVNQTPYATMAKCESELASGRGQEINPPSLPSPTSTPPFQLCQTSKDTPETCNTGLGLLSTTAGGFVQSILGILLSLSGMVALYLIIRSGYQLMTSRGNPEAI